MPARLGHAATDGHDACAHRPTGRTLREVRRVRPHRDVPTSAHQQAPEAARAPRGGAGCHGGRRGGGPPRSRRRSSARRPSLVTASLARVRHPQARDLPPVRHCRGASHPVRAPPPTVALPSTARPEARGSVMWDSNYGWRCRGSWGRCWVLVENRGTGTPSASSNGDSN